jgi:hypothetical protein
MGVSGQHQAPAALYSPRKNPGTHWREGWVDPRTGLDAGARRKLLCLCRGSNPDRPARSQTLYRLRYRGSPRTNRYQSYVKKSQRNGPRHRSTCYLFIYLFIFYLTTLSTAQIIYRLTTRRLVNNELETMWKEAITVKLLPWNLPGGTEKNLRQGTGLRAEIGSLDRPSTKQTY